MKARFHPVGKMQQMVLDALGWEATDFTHANQIFRQHGFTVGHKRDGNKYIPTIHWLPTDYGDQYSEIADDNGYIKFTEFDLEKIRQWIV